MAAILKSKCSNYNKVSLEVSSFEEWNYDENQKFHMIYCAQAFHWLDTNIKYKKCHEYLKDNGYLVLFWYDASDKELELTEMIDQKVNEVVEKYTNNNSLYKETTERYTHKGSTKKEERRAEIEESGLFHVLEIKEYTEEIKNNAEQYLKVKKSIPAFASILDGLDHETIEKMDNEIKGIIHSHGGYVGSLFSFTLYIARRIS